MSDNGMVHEHEAADIFARKPQLQKLKSRKRIDSANPDSWPKPDMSRLKTSIREDWAAAKAMREARDNPESAKRSKPVFEYARPDQSSETDIFAMLENEPVAEQADVDLGAMRNDMCG